MNNKRINQLIKNIKKAIKPIEKEINDYYKNLNFKDQTENIEILKFARKKINDLEYKRILNQMN